MSTITVTALSRKAITDPALAQVVDEVAAVLKLEVARALATGHVPAAPVARRARATVGQVALESWFVRLPAAKQRQVREGVIRTVQATPALARKARELGVNLASDHPVPEQVDLTARVGKLDQIQGHAVADVLATRLGHLGVRLPGRTPGGSVAPHAGGIIPNKGVRFRVHRVSCVDDTDPEAGKDEIAMGGTAVAADGTETTLDEFTIGKFKDGDIVTFGTPKELKSFTLDGAVPATFAVFLAIAEKDAGGFSAFLTELYDAIKNQVAVVLTAAGTAAGAVIGSAVGGALGTAIGGPLGTVIGIVSGLILGALVGFIAGVAQDEIFEPQVATLTLDAPDATFADGSLQSPVFDFTFADFGGQYTVSYSWQLLR